MHLTRILLALSFCFGFAIVACGGPDPSSPDETTVASEPASDDATEASEDALRPPTGPTLSSCSATGGTCCNKKGQCWSASGCSQTCPAGMVAQCSNGSCTSRGVALGGTCGCYTP